MTEGCHPQQAGVVPLSRRNHFPWRDLRSLASDVSPSPAPVRRKKLALAQNNPLYTQHTVSNIEENPEMRKRKTEKRKKGAHPETLAEFS